MHDAQSARHRALPWQAPSETFPLTQGEGAVTCGDE